MSSFVALVDCNAFYCSAEILFNPALRDKPVAVLSSNDGIIVALNKECKDIGLKRGDAAFQKVDIIEKYDVAVFSSNYTLYDSISQRVMQTLATFTDELSIYSIDEAFVSLKGMEHLDLREYGRTIVKTVGKNIGIPVGVGIAKTYTLAKLANRFAKKYPAYKSVCMIETEAQRVKALQMTDIEDVWGIGRRYAKKLRALNVNTAWDFTQLSREHIRKISNVTLERTWDELRGVACIDLESDQVDKKSIATTRTFGKMLSDYDSIAEAVATHAESCATKLRKQKSCAVSIMVFIHTNPHREDLPQYWQNTVTKLTVPTSSSIELVQYAKDALKRIYREGYHYKKAGVIVTQIVKQDQVQTNLFETVDRSKHSKLMAAMDSINGRMDKHRVFLASQGIKKSFKMKQEKLSPNYTTDINDIIKVK